VLAHFCLKKTVKTRFFTHFCHEYRDSAKSAHPFFVNAKSAHTCFACFWAKNVKSVGTVQNLHKGCRANTKVARTRPPPGLAALSPPGLATYFVETRKFLAIPLVPEMNIVTQLYTNPAFFWKKMRRNLNSGSLRGDVREVPKVSKLDIVIQLYTDHAFFLMKILRFVDFEACQNAQES